jgi:hypothetical protein
VKVGGKTLFCGIIAVLVIFVGAFFVTAKEGSDCPAEAPKGNVTIKSPAWEKHTKCPVDFSHQAHAEDYEIACADCHHVYKDGKNVWEQGQPACPCASCHTDLTIEGEKKLPEDQQKLNLKLAYHDNCIACHRNLKKEDPKTGAPVTCTGCHPKECP